jgi:intergrase/recombinase
MTEGDANIDAMINWVKQAHYLAPKYRHVLRYAYLTGLRPEEVFMSLRLSNDGNYYNKEKGILEHYRHPDLFIRQKKKAYVSVMTEELSQLRAINTNGLSYNALRLTMRRNHTPMNMQYCRRIFGTYLRQQGIETELIDLLQGRLPKTVFLRFYNRPNFKDECEKVRNCLIKLSAEITL